MPPDTADDSGRVLACTVAVEAPEACDEPETVREGEMCAMAEPGRAGRCLEFMARFCAIIASLKLGLDEVMVLLERPRPGRAGPLVSPFFGELGLLTSFWRSFCAWLSRFSMMLRTSITYISQEFGLGLTFLRVPAR